MEEKQNGFSPQERQAILNVARVLQRSNEAEAEAVKLYTEQLEVVELTGINIAGD